MPKKSQTIRILMLIQITLSIVMIIVGSVTVSRPLFVLDALFTPQEMHNEEFIEPKLAILQKSANMDAAFWFIAGGLSFVIGVACFCLAAKSPGSESST